MSNKLHLLLFSIITLTLCAFVGVGAYGAFSNPSETFAYKEFSLEEGTQLEQLPEAQLNDYLSRYRSEQMYYGVDKEAPYQLFSSKTIPDPKYPQLEQLTQTYKSEKNTNTQILRTYTGTEQVLYEQYPFAEVGLALDPNYSDVLYAPSGSALEETTSKIFSTDKYIIVYSDGALHIIEITKKMLYGTNLEYIEIINPYRYNFTEIGNFGILDDQLFVELEMPYDGYSCHEEIGEFVYADINIKSDCANQYVPTNGVYSRKSVIIKYDLVNKVPYDKTISFAGFDLDMIMTESGPVVAATAKSPEHIVWYEYASQNPELFNPGFMKELKDIVDGEGQNVQAQLNDISDLYRTYSNSNPICKSRCFDDRVKNSMEQYLQKQKGRTFRSYLAYLSPSDLSLEYQEEFSGRFASINMDTRVQADNMHEYEIVINYSGNTANLVPFGSLHTDDYNYYTVNHKGEILEFTLDDNDYVVEAIAGSYILFSKAGSFSDFYVGNSNELSTDQLLIPKPFPRNVYPQKDIDQTFLSDSGYVIFIETSSRWYPGIPQQTMYVFEYAALDAAKIEAYMRNEGSSFPLNSINMLKDEGLGLVDIRVNNTDYVMHSPTSFYLDSGDSIELLMY